MVIHLPSLGLTEGQRRGLSKPHLRENSQMARLCDLADPLVEVLYVAPFGLPEVSCLPCHQRLTWGLMRMIGCLRKSVSMIRPRLALAICL